MAYSKTNKENQPAIMPTLTAYPDNHVITAQDAELLISRGACDDAFDFVGETVGQACEAAPWFALEFAASLLTPERLDQCAEAHPWFALEYAASLLTPERLDQCAKANPRAALFCAASLLTPERLDWCAKRCPSTALRYAASLLTPERLDACKALEASLASNL